MGGPFIGPRGGKWADAAHTIPYGFKGDSGGKGHVKALQDHLEKTHGAKVSLSHHAGVTTLHMVKVPESERGKGVGNAVMHALKRHADKHGHRIALTAEAHGKGGLSTSKLKKWYKAHGFVENKGKHKDYEVSEGMYREPTTSKSVIYYITPNLLKSDEGGWEKGPRGGTRKKVGGKWVYKQESSGGKGSSSKNEEPSKSGGAKKEAPEKGDDDHFIQASGFVAKLQEALASGQKFMAEDHGGKHPHAGQESSGGKIDDWGRPERDFTGKKNPDWGKPPKKGEKVDHPETKPKEGDQVLSTETLSKLPVGTILKVSWDGINTAFKKMQDNSWAGSGGKGGGAGGDFTSILSLLMGLAGFAVTVSSIGLGTTAALGAKAGQAIQGGAGGGGSSPPGKGPLDGTQKSLLYVPVK